MDGKFLHSAGFYDNSPESERDRMEKFCDVNPYEGKSRFCDLRRKSSKEIVIIRKLSCISCACTQPTKTHRGKSINHRNGSAHICTMMLMNCGISKSYAINNHNFSKIYIHSFIPGELGEVCWWAANNNKQKKRWDETWRQNEDKTVKTFKRL